MANNKTTIRTLPLDLKLNMNKNEQLVDSSFTMVNKNNSPVYGSTLTNIHVSTTESGNAIWDRKGERYYIEGDTFKSTNPYFSPIDLSNAYFFEKSSIDLDIDGISYVGLPSKKGIKEWPDNLKKQFVNHYVAFKLENGKAKVYCATTLEKLVISQSSTIEPYSEDYNIVAARLVPVNEKCVWKGSIQPYSEDPLPAGAYDTSQGSILLTVQEATTINDNDKDASTARNKLLVAYGVNLSINSAGKEKIFTGRIGAVPIVLGQLANDSVNKTLISSVTNKTGTTVKQTATTNSNYQIIVSSIDFTRNNYRSWTSATQLKGDRGPTFGITILKNKMKAANVTTDLYYDNILAHMDTGWNTYIDLTTLSFYNWTLNEETKDSFELTTAGKYLTVGTSLRSNTSIIRVPGGFAAELGARTRGRSSAIAYSNNAKSTVSETYYSASNGWGGIFIDDTPYIIAVKPTSSNGCLLGTVTGYESNESDVQPNPPFYDPSSSSRYNVNTGAVPSLIVGPPDLIVSSLRNLPKDFTGAFISGNEKYGVPNTLNGWCLTTNQRYARLLVYGKNTGNDETGKNNTGSMMVDTAQPDTVFTSVGLQSTQTIPTTAGGWSTWSTNQANDSNYVCYNSQGSISKVGATNWRLLINYKEGYISGISYGKDGQLGKLVTEWDSIDDGFYVFANEECVIYRNTRNGKVYRIERKAFADIDEAEKVTKFKLVDERYLIGNIDIELNAFDTVENKLSNWGNDWNNRVFPGLAYSVTSSEYTEVPWLKEGAELPTFEQLAAYCTSSTNAYVRAYFRTWNTIIDDGVRNWVNSGSIASGVSVAYTATKAFSPSRLEAYQSYTGLLFGYETFLHAGSTEGLDLYEAKTASTPVYRYSVKLDTHGSTYTHNETIIEGLNYPVAPTGSSYQNIPVVGVDYIESYNGKFAVKIDDTVYGIVYNGIRPIGLYNTASLTDDIEEFFIVQGQYYAIVNGYIAAVYYSSSGTLSSIEQIININGMQFIGAFPSVAYFYAPATQSIYAFTGDADLQLFVQSNRVTQVDNYLYDPGSEWILLNTNDGLYVLTQINVFKAQGLKDVHDFFSTDDGYVVVIWDSDYKNTKIALRKIDDTFSTLPVEIETVYYGPGDLRLGRTTCWYIRLYRNNEDYNGVLEYSVSTLTDTVKKGKKNKIVVTKDDWDAQDNFFVRAQPDLDLGQGTSLYLKSDYPIALIAVEVTEESNPQISRFSF